MYVVLNWFHDLNKHAWKILHYTHISPGTLITCRNIQHNLYANWRPCQRPKWFQKECFTANKLQGSSKRHYAPKVWACVGVGDRLCLCPLCKNLFSSSSKSKANVSTSKWITFNLSSWLSLSLWHILVWTWSMFPVTYRVLRHKSHIKHYETCDAIEGKQTNCWGESDFLLGTTQLGVDCSLFICQISKK